MTVECPGCAAKLNTRPEHAGKVAKCKRCGAAVRIPAATSDAGASGGTSSSAPAGPTSPPGPLSQKERGGPRPAAQGHGTRYEEALPSSMPPPLRAGEGGRGGEVSPPAPKPRRAIALPPLPPPSSPPDAPLFAPPEADEPDPLDFAPSPVVSRTLRPPPKRSGGRLIPALLVLAALGLVGAGVLFREPLLELAQKSAAPGPAPKPAAPPASDPGASLAAASRPFPRRLLVLSVTKYLYWNPLSGGNSRNADLTRLAARRLAHQWRVPAEGDSPQLTVLSDTSPEPTAMLRATLLEGVRRFAATSRAQDRVAVYFGGHAAMVDGKAYLIPTEGDSADANTLVPVGEVFAALAGSKAQEKLLILDVCRLGESGDRQRPGGEPMSAELRDALTKVPAGLSVVLTTGAGANAPEFRDPPPEAPEVGGSLFLSAIRHLATQGSVPAPADESPDSPLPASAWLDAVERRMKFVCADARRPFAPLTRVLAKPGERVPADPDEPPAAAVELPPAPAALPVAEVERVAKRIAALPPFRGERDSADAVERLVPFAAGVLAPYQPDAASDEAILARADEAPVPAAAVRALAVIRQQWRSGRKGDTGLRTELVGGTDEALKKQILSEQERPAIIEDELDSSLMALEKVAPKLAEEPSRYWRATFQYALAQTRARKAFMAEYNLALGNIRTDSLPAVDPKRGRASLVLVSSEKMKSKKDVKDLAESAGELFAQIAKDHPGTPWAVEARRHQLLALGLEWKQAVSGVAVAEK